MNLEGAFNISLIANLDRGMDALLQKSSHSTPYSIRKSSVLTRSKSLSYLPSYEIKLPGLNSNIRKPRIPGQNISDNSDNSNFSFTESSLPYSNFNKSLMIDKNCDENISIKRNAKKNTFLRAFLSSYKARADQMARNFKNSPAEKSQLLADFNCAYVKKNSALLIQGRLFFADKWVLFYSKIFSKETRLIFGYDEIKDITKERTAFVVPNAIMITTILKEKHFFTSFTARNRAYEILIELWDNFNKNYVYSQSEIRSIIKEYYASDSGSASGSCEDSDDEKKTNPLSSGIELDSQHIIDCKGHEHFSDPLFSIEVRWSSDTLFGVLFPNKVASMESDLFKQYLLNQNLLNYEIFDWVDTCAWDNFDFNTLPEPIQLYWERYDIATWRTVEYTVSHPIRSINCQEFQLKLKGSSPEHGYFVLSKVVYKDSMLPKDFFLEKTSCILPLGGDSCFFKVTARVNMPQNTNFILRKMLSSAPKEMEKRHEDLKNFILECNPLEKTVYENTVDWQTLSSPVCNQINEVIVNSPRKKDNSIRLKSRLTILDTVQVGFVANYFHSRTHFNKKMILSLTALLIAIIYLYTSYCIVNSEHLNIKIEKQLNEMEKDSDVERTQKAFQSRLSILSTALLELKIFLKKSTLIRIHQAKLPPEIKHLLHTTIKDMNQSLNALTRLHNTKMLP